MDAGASQRKICRHDYDRPTVPTQPRPCPPDSAVRLFGARHRRGHPEFHCKRILPPPKPSSAYEGVSNYEVFTLKERPDLRSGIFAAAFRPPFFPEFMVHDPAGQLYFSTPFFNAYPAARPEPVRGPRPACDVQEGGSGSAFMLMPPLRSLCGRRGGLHRAPTNLLIRLMEIPTTVLVPFWSNSPWKLRPDRGLKFPVPR